MTSTEVVTLTKDELTAWLSGADISDDDNTEEMDYATAMRILGAETPEAALADDDMRPSQSLVGQTFAILGVTWRKSTKSEDGAGRYALLRCADADGAKFLTSCGATKVVLQVRKAEIARWLPWVVTLEANDTASGRTMLQLVAPDPDVEGF